MQMLGGGTSETETPATDIPSELLSGFRPALAAAFLSAACRFHAGRSRVVFEASGL